MHIVFDMDNTLADELGTGLRPGALATLTRLSAQGHRLSLWTSSRRSRAVLILKELDLARFFSTCIYREDYDPQGKGNEPKDIRRIGGELLVDDDPKQISFVRSVGCRGLLVTPYRQGAKTDPAELAQVEKLAGGSWFSRFLRRG